MYTLGYFLKIFISLCLLSQSIVLLIYTWPFFSNWYTKNSIKRWNPFYDRIITILLLCFIGISLLFGNLIFNITSSTSTLLALFHTLLVCLLTVIISILVFKREKLITVKTKEQLDNEEKKIKKNQKKAEQIQQRKIDAKNLKEIKKSQTDEIIKRNFEQERIIINSKIITGNLEEIKKIHLEEIVILKTQNEKSQLDVEIITQGLEEIIKVSSEEIIEKLGPKKPSNEKKASQDYHSLFNQNQLIYLWTNLKKYKIIDDNYLKDDFCKNFLKNEIMFNMESFSLYYFHKEISKITTKKIVLGDFITFFKNEKNNEFLNGSVRNGSCKNHKLISVFESIFKDFPK